MTVDSPTYAPYCGKRQYYYQAVEMSITTAGWYRFWNFYIDIFILIYIDEFNPRLPFDNLIGQEQGRWGPCDGIRIFLHAHRKYVAVVRMDLSNKTRPIFIHALGLNTITFALTSKN